MKKKLSIALLLTVTAAAVYAENNTNGADTQASQSEKKMPSMPETEESKKLADELKKVENGGEKLTGAQLVELDKVLTAAQKVNKDICTNGNTSLSKNVDSALSKVPLTAKVSGFFQASKLRTAILFVTFVGAVYKVYEYFANKTSEENDSNDDSMQIS